MDLTNAQSLAQAIALVLGDGWTYKVPPEEEKDWPSAYIIKGDYKLFVWVKSYGSDKGKATIRGILPTRDVKGSYVEVSRKVEINVNARIRTAESMASDIRRRLLPVYFDAFKEAQAKVAETNSYLLSKEEAFKKITSQFPVYVHPERSGETTAGIYMGNVYGDLRVDSANNVKLELRCLSPKLATAILMLCEHERKKETG